MPSYYDKIGGFGGSVRTPAFVLAEMRTVESAIVSLGNDIQRVAAQLPEGFMQDWIAFRVEWDSFYKENDGWISRATNAVYDKTIEFRERAQSWRDKFVRLGGKPSVPELPEGRTYPVAGILIGVGVVGFALWYLFKADHNS